MGQRVDFAPDDARRDGRCAEGARECSNGRLCLFLGPGFRLAARWNRLVETVKTRKKREKTVKKWVRYGLKGGGVGITCQAP